MRMTRVLAGAFALTLLTLSWPTSRSSAQVLPVENHYLVYNLRTPMPIAKQVDLRDQFGKVSVTSLVFEKFATPAEKIHNGVVYPMVNPDIHQDWWRINSTQPVRTVIVTDQFGSSKWQVAHASYLLLPSLKNLPGPGTPLPTWNHYLCYDVVPPGLLVDQLVVLKDQFGGVQVQVLHARFLCNPVEKTVRTATGTVTYPIIDATAHLACYDVSGPGFPTTSITAYDQFGFWPVQIQTPNCMCVPALKEEPVRTERSTWGKIKALYRD